jgi:hypothetical protein
MDDRRMPAPSPRLLLARHIGADAGSLDFDVLAETAAVWRAGATVRTGQRFDWPDTQASIDYLNERWSGASLPGA